MSARLLITGGAGFRGSNLIKYLLNRYPSYKVINFDKIGETDDPTGLSSLANNPNYIFVKGDVSLERDVQYVFEEYRPDYVIHFAAHPLIDRNLDKPSTFVLTNVIGTQNIILNSREKEVKRIIHISTSKVYGTSKYAAGMIDEETIMKPSNPYVASKAAADLFVQAAHRRHKLNTIILRPTNTYGPFQFPEKLIPTIIDCIRQNKDIPIFGSIETVRDWLHIEDYSRAIDLALHKGVAGETYNISSGDTLKSIDLIRLIGRIMGTEEPKILQLKERLEDDSYPTISSEKIKNELNWSQTVNLEDGLRATVDWYVKHPEWIQEAYSSFYQ